MGNIYLFVNVNNLCFCPADHLNNALKIFEEDLKYSEDYNPAVAFNNGGKHGIDWSINYNGDICTWQNQVRDNYMNLYEDEYKEILEANFEDPITYSIIDKGSAYRDNIVAEVNNIAVLRTKAISLRDTSGVIIFEEEKTRLYYAIRVLQDYIKEEKISELSMVTWPSDIRSLVILDKKDLIKLHNTSSFSIVSQQILKQFNEEEWYDFLELLKLGHYDLTKIEIERAIDYYNKHATNKITCLSE